jgi:membrane protein YqaA with SNARE-associated domain
MKIEKKTLKFIEREERFINYEWNHYKTVLIILIIFLTLESYLTGSLQQFFDSLGKYGYIGSFISGFLYTYGVTTPFAIAAFFILAKYLNIWLLTLLGTFGGLIGEYFIYDFAKKEVGKSVRIYKNKKIKLPEIKSKFLKKITPLIAGLIIATPIPDEFLALLFGIEKYKLRDFLILTFISKFIGILLIVGLGRIF